MSEARLVDETTVRAVCDYLHENFRADRVVPFVDHGVQGFRIDDMFGTPRYVLAVRSEFFDTHTPPEIPAALRQFRVAAALRQAGRTRVEVTTSGVRVTDAKPSGAERTAGSPEKRA